ncbi:MAG: phage portal protein [Phycisphaerales bacterium]
MAERIDELVADLQDQRHAYNGNEVYYRHGGGDPYMPAGARAEYQRLVQEAAANWCELIIDVVVERLVVEGFRTAGSTEAVGELWSWWQANKLDGRQSALYTDALVGGVSYVGVWPAEDASSSPPKITVETPRAVLVVHDEADPTMALEAVKVGPDQTWHYTPDTVTIYEARHGGGGLVMVEDFANPLGEVPFVAFKTKPNGAGVPTSDLESARPIQDRITTTTFDRLIAQKYAAFRQRWVTGMAIPVDDDGEAIEPFQAAVDRLWMSEDPDTSFGEFQESNLAGYIAAVDQDIQTLASTTRTPPHYLLGKIVNLSADALKAAETGLTSKVRRRQVEYGEAWEAVVNLAAIAAGQPELVDDGLETIWANTEAQSEAQVVDAALKLDALGVPREAIWERIGASPQQIDAWRRQRMREALRSAVSAPIDLGGGRPPATAVLAGQAPPTGSTPAANGSEPAPAQ